MLLLAINVQYSFLFRQTNYKQMIVCFQFPDKYPTSGVMVELKSRHISQKLLDGLAKLAETEAKKHSGKPQVSLSKQKCYHFGFIIFLFAHETTCTVILES